MYLKRFQKQICLVFLVMLCLLCAGTLNRAHAAKRCTLVKGQTKQLLKTARKWRSNRPAVATVSSEGVVTAVKKGTCIVTARKGKKKYSWTVKVEAPRLGRTNKSIAVGKSFNLMLKKTNLKFKWSVSDPSVLTLRKKSANKVKVTGLKNGTATVNASRGPYTVSCTVVVGTGAEAYAAPAAPAQDSLQTLYLDGNVFKQLTWNRTDTAKYVSNVSRYGQSAPLYIHKDGGDGLENIWAAENNGAVGLTGVKLSADAVKGTIDKACLWARAVADSPYHGYDYGHSYPDAALMYTFGQAKANALGTGDYCCSTIPLCAYYFAGVNVIGENLGGPDAKYIPNSTLLFYRSQISYYLNGTLHCDTNNYRSNYEWEIFQACGFKDVYSQYAANPDSFVFKAGDVVTANGHTQMVISDGTKKTAETVQAYGPDKHNKMPIGGDQNYEIGRAYYVSNNPKIRHIMRFTGNGVRLNTVGLVG